MRWTLGPDISDIAGNLMDQTEDGQLGQPDDAYTAMLDLRSPDLAVISVDDPVAAVFGEQMTLNWSVRNEGSDPAEGLWWDYVYVSTNATWDLGDQLVGKYLYDANTLGAIGANGIYDASINVPVPGLLPDDYHLIVRSNILQNLTEADFSDNQLASTNAAAFDLPVLESGVATPTDVNYRDALYYKIVVPAEATSGSLVLRFGTDNTNVANELYIRRDALPTRAEYDARSQQGLSSNQWIIQSNLQPGTYYVLALAAPDQSQVGPLGTASAQADLLVPGEFRVLDSFFGQGGTAGNRTIEITGANFDRSLTVALSNGTSVVAEATGYYRPGP